MFDFKSISSSSSIDTILSPRDIFSALPTKNKKYQYPRDVQTQVWTEWNNRKNEKNLVIKMNTGSGKTVVGLIILKSSINEGIYPAVYAVPNNFLVKQVFNEAKELGIKATDNPESLDFLNGKEILICNMDKLVNGKSIFGVGQRKINIGTLLIDDAHACLESVEQQFTINISKMDKIYSSVLEIFLPSIEEQSQSKALELKNSLPNTIAYVPFWSWKTNLNKITKILYDNMNEKHLLFSYPLLKEHIKFCRCVLSDDKIEITPHSIPIGRITSLELAKRKIFMTATLVDDSILASHFDVNEIDLKNAITPSSAGDIGERLILAPQDLNPLISDVEIKNYLKFLSKENNVVVITPSKLRTEFWKDKADLILTSENIEEGIYDLKNRHVGLVIIVNRYDGIDLPEEACRILVIDGLPDSRRLIDQITESQLTDSEKAINQKIQKIEQGMGRGIRSNDDFCVIILIGKKLLRYISGNDQLKKFSSATKEQLLLSKKISEQLKNKSLRDISGVIKQVLDRDKDWISLSKSTLSSLVYSSNKPDEYTISLRKAFNFVCINQFDNAINELSNLSNKFIDKDNILYGFILQTLAEYVNYCNEVESQEILLSAINNNKYLLKPKTGISYQRIKSVDEQANQLQNYLLAKYGKNSNQIIIDIDSILEDLVFIPNTSNRFEEAIKNLGLYLGFSAHRPENNYGRGPDNLWVTGSNKYFVIECKNGVSNEIINKHDINQLNGSSAWFIEEYDNQDFTSIMIHLGNMCEYGATPLPNCRVMDFNKMNLFKNNFRECLINISKNINNLSEIKKLLTQYKLRDIDLVSTYTLPIKIKDISS